jgi:hypothetical protein
MICGWASYDERTIARLRAEGQGSGVGSAYLPWLTVRDVSSHGLSTRTKGWKTRRVHHVLSNLELKYLYCLEWSLIVTDIREQYPLALEETQRIADTLGVAHPRHRHAHTPVVMTTDFLVTAVRHGVASDEARTMKHVHDLSSRRTLEKFEIERIYWRERGVDWGLVTEREIVPALAHNVERIHEPRSYVDYTALTPDEFADASTLLTRDVQTSADPLRRVTTRCDRTLGLESGTSLTIAYHLIATRQWHIDMCTPIDPTQPLTLLEARIEEPSGDEW